MRKLLVSPSWQARLVLHCQHGCLDFQSPPVLAEKLQSLMASQMSTPQADPSWQPQDWQGLMQNADDQVVMRCPI